MIDPAELRKAVEEYIEMRRPLDDVIERTEFIKQFMIQNLMRTHGAVDRATIVTNLIEEAKLAWARIEEDRNNDLNKLIDEGKVYMDEEYIE